MHNSTFFYSLSDIIGKAVFFVDRHQHMASLFRRTMDLFQTNCATRFCLKVLGRKFNCLLIQRLQLTGFDCGRN